jgi:hypothetical protein
MTYNTINEDHSQEDEKVYDPDENYYFLSYESESEKRWIRAPWLTASQLRMYLYRLSYDLDENYSDICVMPEDLLDERIYVKAESGEFKEISLRSFLYDFRYEIYAHNFRKQSLSDTTCNGASTGR